MTLIEKLKNAISEHKQDAENNRSEDSNVDAVLCARNFGKIAGLEEALEIVKEHSDWVSVSEDLPKTDGEYEVYFEKSLDFYLTMAISEWNTKRQRFDLFNSRITHWKKCPRPPSEVTN